MSRHLSYWKSRSTHCPDGRRIVTKRRVSCSACGELSIHFDAQYDPELNLFAVPYAGLNAGTGEEVHGNEYTPEEMGNKERDVFMSECCREPRRVWRKRSKQRRRPLRSSKEEWLKEKDNG